MTLTWRPVVIRTFSSAPIRVGRVLCIDREGNRGGWLQPWNEEDR